MKKRSKMLRAALGGFFLLVGIHAHSQDLIVTFTNSSTQSFPVSGIRSIKFGVSDMIINQHNGTSTSYAISDINNYAFDTKMSVLNPKGTQGMLDIFPNPASDLVNIAYESTFAEDIMIDILDASGRLVKQLFKGKHLDKKEYQWKPEGIGSGAYTCRITSENKVITRPVIIQ